MKMFQPINKEVEIKMPRHTYTDVPDNQLNFMLAIIAHSQGEIVDQGEEADGENFIVVDYPGPSPEAATTAADTTSVPWMAVAEAEIGMREVAGAGNNKRISEYFEATSLGLQPDSVPWCAAFVNWVMREVGHDFTNSAMARSWIDYGKNSGGLVHGSIVVLKRGTPPAGHVGFCVKADKNTVWLLGGNQNDEVNVTGFKRSLVIAHRLPN